FIRKDSLMTFVFSKSYTIVLFLATISILGCSLDEYDPNAELSDVELTDKEKERIKYCQGSTEIDDVDPEAKKVLRSLNSLEGSLVAYNEPALRMAYSGEVPGMIDRDIRLLADLGYEAIWCTNLKKYKIRKLEE
ncbi:MAG: hypothetical protein MPJ24_08885, partial [Pirellulaceae bacterium]|nr:hypothetical protein [Pirellulaceae bacterium]